MAGGAPGWEATWDLMEETESEGATVKVKERGGLVDLKVRDTEAGDILSTRRQVERVFQRT